MELATRVSYAHSQRVMPPNQNRTRRIHLVASPDEYEMAKALAERKGLTVSDIVRMQIREAYEREFGDLITTAKKKPKR
jgi:hypothetical protein